MIRKIVGTIFTRILIAALTLATVLINGWFLGAEKVGTISLIILAITLIQMLNNFVGGSAVVYLLPRTNLITLLVPSWAWAFVTAIAGASLLSVFNLIPGGYFWHVTILALILSLASVNFMILMGQERIKGYNIITLFQAVCFFAVLIFWLFMLDQREVRSYLAGLYISYSLAFIMSMFLVLRHARWGKFEGMMKVLREIFTYGSVMQTGNILQFLNYRLSYYFMELFMGRAALGVYSVGVQMSESVWLMSRSIAMVQYARISNEKDAVYASRLTLSLVKISFLVTLLCLVLLFGLLLLIFPLIFKPEFNSIKIIMLALAVGIVTFSVSINLSPYFSGTGKPLHNTVSAAIGLLFTLVAGLLLIPRFGFIGAGLCASLSYLAATLYQFIVFGRLAKIRLMEFLITKKDFAMFNGEWKRYLKSAA